LPNYYGTCPTCGKENTKLRGCGDDKRCGKCHAARQVWSPCACGCGEPCLNQFKSGHNTKFLSSEEQGRRGKLNRMADWSKRSTAKPSTYKKVMGRHEHKWVAELKLGRALQKGEVVHHIDGNKHNNSPENLAVMTQAEHCKLHNFGKPNE
jgi:hypothetical protein